MRNDDERSYERYKQYRRNKYRYEQEQIIFPIAIIIGLSIIISLWKYILIAIAVVSFLAIVVAILYLYLKKQLKSEQDIVLSKEDAKEGVEAKISVLYDSQIVSFVFDIPSDVKNGQKFVAKNILFENKKIDAAFYHRYFYNDGYVCDMTDFTLNDENITAFNQ